MFYTELTWADFQLSRLHVFCRLGYYIRQTSPFYTETVLLDEASNAAVMSHALLARTYTHSAVSLAATGGIVLSGPDLESEHASCALETVIDGNQTKTQQKHCNSLLMKAPQLSRDHTVRHSDE